MKIQYRALAMGIFLGFSLQGESALEFPKTLAETAERILLEMPCTTPNLKGMTAVGLSLVGPLSRIHQNSIGGIFYASEYWGCVLGGGDWQECGDIARAKWGCN